MIPPISLESSESRGRAGLVGICINASNMPQQPMSFWLTFLPTNPLLRPFVCRVDSSAVMLHSNSIIEMNIRSSDIWRGNVKRQE